MAEIETAALTGSAFTVQLDAVTFCDAAGNGETKSSAIRVVGMAAMESLENMGKFIGINACAIVTDGNLPFRGTIWG